MAAGSTAYWLRLTIMLVMSGSSSAVTVTVDNTSPTASITSPAAAAFLRGTVNIAVTASDANGISKV